MRFKWFMVVCLLIGVLSCTAGCSNGGGTGLIVSAGEEPGSDQDKSGKGEDESSSKEASKKKSSKKTTKKKSSKKSSEETADEESSEKKTDKKSSEEETDETSSEKKKDKKKSKKKSGTDSSVSTVKDPVDGILPAEETYEWDPDFEYAEFSKIHSDSVTVYRPLEGRNGVVVAIDPGHGTFGGSQVMTQAHPDGSPKVKTGNTNAGRTESVAISMGYTMDDGMSEADAVLGLAEVMREDLLSAGYDVLMIRETKDTQLDNIARAVFANEYADCHISLHYDNTDTDKGFFYISVPENEEYRKMEPVASHWKEHMELGDAILSGMKENKVKIYGDGREENELTQTSYSTIPSVDLEVGDRATSHEEEDWWKLSDGVVAGLNQFFPAADEE